MAELRRKGYKKRNHAPNECREAMKNLPKTGSNTPPKRKNLKEAPAHPKDAYTHPTSVNGNLDTRRKPVKRKVAKKV